MGFAYADSSRKAPSDDTVISARSSLSSNSNSVPRGDIKRELNANAQSGIVTRQLNASIGTRMSGHSNQAQPQRTSQTSNQPQKTSRTQRRKVRKKNHEWPTLSATQMRGQRGKN